MMVIQQICPKRPSAESAESAKSAHATETAKQEAAKL